MHAECERAKADLARRLEDTKTRGGADAKPLKEALKSFDRGYGPLLEKCGDAVAKHKLNDVKKYAADALKVAQKYLPAVRSLPGGNGTLAAAVLPDRIEKFRTPDVVEFAVSPQVGQAVLACPPPAKLSPSKGMAQPIFPAGLKLQGDIRSSEVEEPFGAGTPADRPVQPGETSPKRGAEQEDARRGGPLPVLELVAPPPSPRVADVTRFNAMRLTTSHVLQSPAIPSCLTVQA
jgi:hypothetical protein